jgi:hypothetical protein
MGWFPPTLSQISWSQGYFDAAVSGMSEIAIGERMNGMGWVGTELD